MPTFGKLYEFVLLNRSNTTFKGYSNGQIAHMLKKGLEEKSLLYLTQNQDEIIGMILACIDHEKKEIFVEENLAMNIDNLKKFARVAKHTFPEYYLAWFKHGLSKKPGTKHFYKKLHLT
jgi:hypothetical protein